MNHYENPVTTTSANRSGDPAARSARDLSWLPEGVMVVERESASVAGSGSTVLRVVGDDLEVLREGDLSSELIRRVWRRKGGVV